MKTLLPGTTIYAEMEENGNGNAESVLNGLFAGGGIMLSQIVKIGGMEPYSVQNWIKRGFCPPPVDKRYDRSQLCRLLTIQMLKDCLPLPDIVRLLSYVNGDLADRSDDTIEDDRLYLMLVRMIALTGSYDIDRAARAAVTVTRDFKEPVPGAAERIREVLIVMTCAYYASLLHHQAEEMMQVIGK